MGQLPPVLLRGGKQDDSSIVVCTFLSTEPSCGWITFAVMRCLSRWMTMACRQTQRRLFRSLTVEQRVRARRSMIAFAHVHVVALRAVDVLAICV